MHTFPSVFAVSKSSVRSWEIDRSLAEIQPIPEFPVWELQVPCFLCTVGDSLMLNHTKKLVKLKLSVSPNVLIQAGPILSDFLSEQQCLFSVAAIHLFPLGQHGFLELKCSNVTEANYPLYAWLHGYWATHATYLSSDSVHRLIPREEDYKRPNRNLCLVRPILKWFNCQ